MPNRNRYLCADLVIKFKAGAGEMAQWAKAPVTKLDGPKSSTPKAPG